MLADGEGKVLHEHHDDSVLAPNAPKLHPPAPHVATTTPLTDQAPSESTISTAVEIPSENHTIASWVEMHSNALNSGPESIADTEIYAPHVCHSRLLVMTSRPLVIETIPHTCGHIHHCTPDVTVDITVSNVTHITHALCMCCVNAYDP